MDPDVIMSRLRKLDTLVGRLKKLQGISYEDYSAHEDMQAVVERLMQLSIQACVDIGNYIIARQELEIPEIEDNVFLILGKHGILPPSLAARIKDMLRFRNILVHDYLEIDQRIVHKILTEQLHDFDDFARAVVAWLDLDKAP